MRGRHGMCLLSWAAACGDEAGEGDTDRPGSARQILPGRRQFGQPVVASAIMLAAWSIAPPWVWVMSRARRSSLTTAALPGKSDSAGPGAIASSGLVFDAFRPPGEDPHQALRPLGVKNQAGPRLYSPEGTGRPG